MVNVDGQWMMRNVIINGINLGKLFRDQFTEAMQHNAQTLIGSSITGLKQLRKRTAQEGA